MGQGARGTVDATIAHARGDLRGAVTAIMLAERSLAACDMKHYVAAAQYRRGVLQADDEGEHLIGAATEGIHGHHMANEKRIVDLLTPGAWPVHAGMA